MFSGYIITDSNNNVSLDYRDLNVSKGQMYYYEGNDKFRVYDKLADVSGSLKSNDKVHSVIASGSVNKVKLGDGYECDVIEVFHEVTLDEVKKAIVDSTGAYRYCAFINPTDSNAHIELYKLASNPIIALNWLTKIKNTSPDIVNHMKKVIKKSRDLYCINQLAKLGV